MRLLLDEMFPAAIAVALREKGFDVLAIQEEAPLRALDDASVFEVARAARRAVVTDNVKDFLAPDAVAHGRGDTHYGLVLTSPASFPRHRRGFVGALTRGLAAFLAEHTGDDPSSGVWWLGSAPD